MNLLFWKKPKYFDFNLPRKRIRDMTLNDFTALAAIIVAAIGYGGATAAIGTYGGLVVSALAAIMYVGASLAVSTIMSALAGKSGEQDSMSTGGLMMNTQTVIDPIKVIYGKARVGGSVVFIDTTGAGGLTNRWLHMIIAWGEGPINGMAEDGRGELIYVTEKRLQDSYHLGQQMVFHNFHNGDYDQEVDYDLKEFFPDWDDPMRGIAYSYFRCAYNSEFWTAWPEFTSVNEGVEVFDPRTGLMAYSTNPALITRDWMINPIYGGGIKGSLVDYDATITAANWFEANGYEFNGAMADRKEFIRHMEDLQLNGRFEVIWSSGKYKMIVQTYGTPVMALDERDIQIDPSRINALGIATAGIQDTPKRIKACFPDPINNYIPSYTFWPEATPYEAETDKEWKEIPLIGCSDFEQALKMGKYLYLRSQTQTTFNCIIHPRYSGLEVGDLISVSHNPDFPVQSIPADWSNKILRVNSNISTQDNRIGLILLDEDEDIYNDTVNVDAHEAYTTDLEETDMPAPTNCDAETGEDLITIARSDAYIEFSWDNMGPGIDYELRWKKETDNAWGKSRIDDPGGEWGVVSAEGTGTLKMAVGGNFEGSAETTYTIEITSAATPNVFRWNDGGAWHTGINVSTNYITLDDGIKIKFDATTGGVIGDTLTFIARPRTPVIFRLGGLPFNTELYWEVRSIKGIGIKHSDWATSFEQITTWKPTDGPSMADVNLVAKSEGSLVLLSWTKTYEDPNIDKWLIYRHTSSTFSSSVLIAEKSRQSVDYRDSQVTVGTLYYYWLKGKDNEGTISANPSAVATNLFKFSTLPVIFKPVLAADVPTDDGVFAFVGDIIQLDDCESVATWNHGASNNSIVLQTATSNPSEGLACIKALLWRYPKVYYYEDGAYLYDFGKTDAKRCFAQGFKLASATDIKAVGIKIYKIGSPGDITVAIYADSGGRPTGSALGSTTLLASSVSTTILNQPKDYTYAVFSSPISLSGTTLYWLSISVASSSSSNYYKVSGYFKPLLPQNQFGDADEIFLIGNSPLDIIDEKPKWDMNFRLGITGDALNKYIWVNLSPSKDLSAKTYFRNWIKSTLRTGIFCQQFFQDSVFGYSYNNISISEVNTWELKSWDISGITGTSRDAIIKMGIYITNMDEDAIIYLDYFYANAGEPVPQMRIGGAFKTFAFVEDLAAKKFSANKNGSNQSSITQNTWVKVTFNNELWDVGSAYDINNSKWIPGVVGYGFISAAIQLTAGPTNLTELYLGIYKNGSLIKENCITVATWGISVATLVDFDADDYFEIYVYIAADAVGTISGNVTKSWFCGHTIG